MLYYSVLVSSNDHAEIKFICNAAIVCFVHSSASSQTEHPRIRRTAEVTQGQLDTVGTHGRAAKCSMITERTYTFTQDTLDIHFCRFFKYQSSVLIFANRSIGRLLIG